MTRGKQILEEAKRIIAEAHERGNNDPMVDLAITLSFTLGARWADKHPHWIRVEDELPKGFAFITDGDDVLIGKYNFEKGLWGVRNKTMFAYTLLPANWKVTHWMPLPSVEHLKEGGKE